jgi:hypothetical protein
MNRLTLGVVALAMAAATTSPALAHVVCGARIFPATLIMDDPGVGDELSLPTVQFAPIPAAGGTPSGQTVDYGFEYDKTITVNDDYFTRYGAGQNLHGFDNVTVTLKDELPCDAADEFVASVGVIREFAGTGSSQLLRAGAIDTVGNTAPTLYAGKGFGDLPIGYFRPFALTGELGYAISDSPAFSPDQWAYAASLQYSMPYLQQNVKALNVPRFFTRLVPLVEVSLSTPTNGPTTGTTIGTISPGVLYEGDTYQVGVEAMIPANAATRQSQGTGFIVQFHLFLDDLLPNSLGKPLFDTDLWQ